MPNKITLTIFFIIALILKLEGQTFQQYVKAGDKAFQQAEYATAIFYYKKAYVFKKKTDDMLFKIGLAHLELKSYEQALQSFSKVKNKEKFPLLYYKMANSFMLTGNYNEAINYYKLFKNNYKESDFYLDDALQKMASCYWAKDHLKINNKVKISALDQTINTEYSEFAAGMFKDSIVQLTSFYQEENKKKNPYISDIVFYKKANNTYEKLEDVFRFNEKNQYANGFYLKEKNRFYFNQCQDDIKLGKRCDIYVSQFENNTWKEAVKLNINQKDFTSTQVSAYVNSEGKDVLFFASNRSESVGQNDIFTTTEIDFGEFSAPTPLSTKINSPGNESTPFYDANNGILYFSSDWHYGFGGTDIFKINLKENGQAKNLGLPFNSSANDLYFYPIDSTKGWFSSNRASAKLLKNVSCCYDVFQYEKKIEKIILKEDTVSLIDSLVSISTDDSLNTLLNKIKEMLPVSVYFHNDEPNPKTTDTVTNLSYPKLYENYTALKDTYYVQNPFNDIDAFFYEHLNQGFIDLKAFEHLLEKIVPNNKVILELSGFCSPLAATDYNLKLAKRRISSVENFFMENEILKKALKNQSLKIKEIPFGEEKAANTVSDDYFNTKNSIFSVAAAKERKVSIIGILLD